MTRIRAHNISVSLDGFMAGPAQAADAPLGAGGEALHAWAWETATLRAMVGQEGGATGSTTGTPRAVTSASARP